MPDSKFLLALSWKLLPYKNPDSDLHLNSVIGLLSRQSEIIPEIWPMFTFKIAGVISACVLASFVSGSGDALPRAIAPYGSPRCCP